MKLRAPLAGSVLIAAALVPSSPSEAATYTVVNRNDSAGSVLLYGYNYGKFWLSKGATTTRRVTKVYASDTYAVRVYDWNLNYKFTCDRNSTPCSVSMAQFAVKRV